MSTHNSEIKRAMICTHRSMQVQLNHTLAATVYITCLVLVASTGRGTLRPQCLCWWRVKPQSLQCMTPTLNATCMPSVSWLQVNASLKSTWSARESTSWETVIFAFCTFIQLNDLTTISFHFKFFSFHFISVVCFYVSILFQFSDIFPFFLFDFPLTDSLFSVIFSFPFFLTGITLLGAVKLTSTRGHVSISCT